MIVYVGRAPTVPIALTGRPFSLDEARRHGLTKHQLGGASWRRIGAGFYAWRGIADSPTVVLIAAQRRLPSSAVFSGRTAAGIRIRRAKLRAGEIITRNGLRATSVVRTLADIGRRSPIVDAVAALDAALHQRLLTLDHLKAWLESYSRFPGVARLRRAIDLAEPATESLMETRLRLLLVFAGLPRPQAQIPLYDEAGRFMGRPDLCYPRHRLAIEYDGSTTSTKPDDRQSPPESVDQQRLQASSFQCC